ncbi:UNKNOWN [Stylonychia lemnae]|uniref:Uncharacterized protein n=1 Tax=Stylonychia lemnae TaxID=5949 RepID=A0A078B8Y9_STYLE|nr:UNKNOWN [Stylonychia lemnae]|eukprot:CDW90013.1 UNKNOWN [Stylonychia lemnae]
MFFHQEFKPQLGSSESSALYADLYNPNHEQSEQYESIYDYFNQNRRKITLNLKKSRKIKLVDTKKVFDKRPSHDSTNMNFKNMNKVKDSFDEKLQMDKLQTSPKYMLKQLEDHVRNEANESGMPNKVHKDKIKLAQIQKSIDIMKKKYESKNNLDILRFFDRLGIDLIIQNQTLYEQFCNRVNQSMNEKKTYYQPNDHLMKMFQKEEEVSINWNQIKKFRRSSLNNHLPSTIKSFDRVAFITAQNEQYNQQSERTLDNMKSKEFEILERILSPKKQMKIKNFLEINKHQISSDFTDRSKLIDDSKMKYGGYSIESSRPQIFRGSLNESPNRFQSLYDFFQKSRFDVEQQICAKKKQNNSQIFDDVNRILDDCTDYTSRLHESELINKVDSEAQMIQKDNELFKEGLQEYLNMEKDELLYGKSLQDVVKERGYQKFQDYENYMNPDVIKKMQDRSNEIAMYLNGKKQIWKPDKFVLSKKSNYAKDLNDLFDKR